MISKFGSSLKGQDLVIPSFAFIDVRSVGLSLIWAIYFAKSERVKGNMSGMTILVYGRENE